MLVLGKWAAKQLCILAPNLLTLNSRDPIVVLTELECISPSVRVLFIANRDVDGDTWVPPRGETADPFDAVSAFHCCLEAAAYRCYVPQKSKCVQEVRLSGGVWPDQKGA